MLNNVVLVGRLTKDLEVKELKDGVVVVNFTIAVQRSYKNESGEYEADFINCVAWNDVAKNIGEFCHKGDLLGVKGELITSSYEKDDVKHYKTEVRANRISFLSQKKVEVKDDGE